MRTMSCSCYRSHSSTSSPMMMGWWNVVVVVVVERETCRYPSRYCTSNIQSIFFRRHHHHHYHHIIIITITCHHYFHHHQHVSNQVKVLINIMNKESALKGSNMFTKSELHQICMRLSLEADVDALIEVMRCECYLLLKGKNSYQLLSSTTTV